jgi:rRNA maturation RNase YbeY
MEMADAGATYKINFHSVGASSWLTNRRLLKRFIPEIFTSERKTLKELNIIFCSDKYLLKINQDYLEHSDYTDIITFDLSADDIGVTGEIYISLERVQENAVLYHNTKTQELLRVIFHGILHLCGFKDKSANEVRKMRAKEDLYLRKYSQFVSRETRST